MSSRIISQDSQVRSLRVVDEILRIITLRFGNARMRFFLGGEPNKHTVLVEALREISQFGDTAPSAHEFFAHARQTFGRHGISMIDH